MSSDDNLRICITGGALLFDSRDLFDNPVVTPDEFGKIIADAMKRAGIDLIAAKSVNCDYGYFGLRHTTDFIALRD
jgi:hypothetical protein